MRTITATLALISATAAQNMLNGVSYPPLDAPPPTNTVWSATYLRGNIPNIPMNGQPLTTPDTAQDITMCSNVNNWAFTFDGGPTTLTTSLLTQLANRGVKATFFVVGSRAYESQDVLKAAYAAGHQIGLSTWTATPLTTQTNDEIVAEILWTVKLVNQLIGVAPKFFMPPYGDIDARVRQIAQNMGLVTTVWSLDSGDLTNPTGVAAVFQQQVNNGRQGTISLESDMTQGAVSQAPAAIDVVTKAGLTPVRMDACAGFAAYDPAILMSVTATPTAFATRTTTNFSFATTTSTSRTTMTTTTSTTSTSRTMTTSTSRSPMSSKTNGQAVAGRQGVPINVKSDATIAHNLPIFSITFLALFFTVVL